MPTPFMHLAIAEQVQERLRPDGQNGRLATLLSQNWSPFYLGSVVPDLSAISDVAREATHFYKIPIPPDVHAVPEMLAANPELADVASLTPEHAVFIAGYSAHLLLDVIWLREIVYPFFVIHDSWSDQQSRRVAHFILLTYFDQHDRRALPKTADRILAAAQSNNWLPFAPDDAINRWQAMLVEQLHPGAPSETINIYAERVGMTPTHFAASLNDPDWMADQVFGKIPVDQVRAVLQTAVPRTIDLINDYLAPIL
ncbi:MAG: zinc dependent phospholipase C family protein [Chloroflexota bacterium]